MTARKPKLFVLIPVLLCFLLLGNISTGRLSIDALTGPTPRTRARLEEEEARASAGKKRSIPLILVISEQVPEETRQALHDFFAGEKRAGNGETVVTGIRLYCGKGDEDALSIARAAVRASAPLGLSLELRQEDPLFLLSKAAAGEIPALLMSEDTAKSYGASALRGNAAVQIYTYTREAQQ